MPYKPKKPCGYNGCPNLSYEYYCDEHRKIRAKDYNRHQRDPAAAKRYGNSWKKIRARYISANPLCEICREHGRLVPANTVHHLLALSDGGTHDWDNLQSLCHSCHSRIHMTELNQK